MGILRTVLGGWVHLIVVSFGLIAAVVGWHLGLNPVEASVVDKAIVGTVWHGILNVLMFPFFVSAFAGPVPSSLNWTLPWVGFAGQAISYWLLAWMLVLMGKGCRLIFRVGKRPGRMA